MKQNCKRLESCVSKGIMCLKKTIRDTSGWVTIPVSLKRSWSSGETTASSHSLKGINSFTWDPHPPLHTDLGHHFISALGLSHLPKQCCKSTSLQPCPGPLDIPASTMIWLAFICPWFLLLLLPGEILNLVHARPTDRPCHLYSALPLCSVLAWFSPTIIRKWPARSQHWLSDSHPFSPSLLPGTPLLKNLYLYVVWFPLVLDFWRQFLLFCSQLSYLLFCYKQLEIQCFFLLFLLSNNAEVDK